MSAKFPRGGGGAGPFLARSLVAVLHICDNLVQILHMCEDAVPVRHTCEF